MLLPTNKPVKYDLSNKLVVWVIGESGVGKTTFAAQWPNPIFLNTDGNYKQFSIPAILIEETMKDDTGQTIYGFDYLNRVIDEFIAQKGQPNSYETIVIDLLEDVVRFCDKMVGRMNGKDSASEIAWGRGTKQVSDLMRNLITKLNSLDANVVYLSHLIEQNTKDINGDDITQFVPKEIKPEMRSMISGRTQLTCVLETVEVPLQDENHNLILDDQGHPKKELYRVLNWEKSPRLPMTVIRSQTLAKYCLATYQDLVETFKS